MSNVVIVAGAYDRVGDAEAAHESLLSVVAAGRARIGHLAQGTTRNDDRELGTPSNEDKAVGINTTRDRIRQTLVRCTRHLTKHAIESSCEADGEAISALQARENPAAA